MENRYVIAETGKRLTGLAADILKQEFNIPPEQVGLAVPGEEGGFSLCILLYNIQKNVGMQTGRPIAAGTGKLRNPSNFYDLHYMLVPYSNGDRKYRMEEELKIMDVLLRKLGDISFLEEERQTVFVLENPDFEEKAKIWNALNQSLRAALYCKVGPVEIASERTKDIKRVTDVQMHFDEK